MVTFIANGQEYQISKTDRVLFITGAGISRASGLPTYWGEGGVYESRSDINIYDELSSENLQHNPGAVWDVLSPIYEKAFNAEPNIAHKVIAKLEDYTSECMVYTQQLDRLHHKAGSSDKSVIEIHGSVALAECSNCARMSGEGGRLKLMSRVNLNILNRFDCPVCPDCNDSLRPFVVPFGGEINQNLLKKVELFCKEKVDYVFIIGTRLSFTHMQFPVYDAFQTGAKIIIVNPEPLQTSDNGLCMSMFDPTYHGAHAKEKSEDFFKKFSFN